MFGKFSKEFLFILCLLSKLFVSELPAKRLESKENRSKDGTPRDWAQEQLRIDKCCTSDMGKNKTLQM